MGALSNDLGLEGLGIGTAFLWHGRPLKKAKNGVHLNLGGHHRLNRWHQEDVLLGRLPPFAELSRRDRQRPAKRLFSADMNSQCWRDEPES
jgi:hypothetical protein